jgi:hypothetical protein
VTSAPLAVAWCCRASRGGRPRGWTARRDVVVSAHGAHYLGPQGFDLDAVAAHVLSGIIFAVRRGAATPPFRGQAWAARGRPRGGENGHDACLPSAHRRAGPLGAQARVHHWVRRSHQIVAFVREHFELADRYLLPLRKPLSRRFPASGCAGSCAAAGRAIRLCVLSARRKPGWNRSSPRPRGAGPARSDTAPGQRPAL